MTDQRVYTALAIPGIYYLCLYEDEGQCEINRQKEYLVNWFISYKQLTLTIGLGILCVMDHACGLARVATVNYHVWVARSKKLLKHTVVSVYIIKNLMS